jgi:DNA-binding CsgD family transcriptional regulator
MGQRETTDLISDLIEAADVAPDLRSIRRAGLGLLQEAFRCEIGYWATWNPSLTPQSYRSGRSHVTDHLPRLEPGFCIESSAGGTVHERLQRFACSTGEFDAPTGIDALFARGGVASHEDMFTTRERDQLPLFTEILHPAGIRQYLACIVNHRGQPLSVLTLSRHDPRPRFTEADKARLHKVCGVLALAEVVARVSASTPAPMCLAESEQHTGAAVRDSTVPSCELPRAVTRSFAISNAEHRVLALMERGLTNAEIGQVLGRSPNTVRNTLASAFRKLDVTRRSEAVYQLRTSPFR